MATLFVLGFFSLGLFSTSIQYSTDVIVNAPLEKSWAIYTDTAYMAMWMPGFKSMKTIEGAPNKVGSRFSLVVERSGQSVEMVEEITAFEPNQRFAYSLTNEVMATDMEVNFSGDGEKTAIKSIGVVRGQTVFWRSVFALMNDNFATQDDLLCNNLKMVIEKAEDIVPHKKFEVVTFASMDGLEITGHLYLADPKAPFILLCHQARFNKKEYETIAPELNALGYNCLAIDQRSGGDACGGSNETALRAEAKKLPTEYVDAEQDILAALHYIEENHSTNTILWGSSYSAGLVLKVAKENESVKAVISFSPGEYYGKALNLANSIQGLDKPTFVTSSRKEADEALKALLMPIDQEKLTQFIPETTGVHGSKALWPTDADQAIYWAAIRAFLKSL